METTEKVVEAYVRYVKGWATIPNLKCKRHHEIDLLAIDPKSNERYHIESTVSVSRGFSKLTADPFDEEAYRQKKKLAKLRRTIEFFHLRKFSPTEIVEELTEYGFREGDYHRIVVTWDWTPEADEQAKGFDIELWSFQDILQKIAAAIEGTRTYFTDDTLRTTLQLFARSKSSLR